MIPSEMFEIAMPRGRAREIATFAGQIRQLYQKKLEVRLIVTTRAPKRWKTVDSELSFRRVKSPSHGEMSETVWVCVINI
jgi:hypothetical protein